MSPFLRTVVLQLTHQGAGRQEHEVHMPGLALAAPPLTIAHAHMLRPVAMNGLRTGPASSIRLAHPMGFPADAIRDQDLAWLFSPLLLPEYHNPHRPADFWQTNGRGEIPLGLVAHRYLRACER